MLGAGAAATAFQRRLELLGGTFLNAFSNPDQGPTFPTVAAVYGPLILRKSVQILVAFHPFTKILPTRSYNVAPRAS